MSNLYIPMNGNVVTVQQKISINMNTNKKQNYKKKSHN